MQGSALSAAIGTYISQLYINGELRDIIEDDVEEKTDHAVGVTIAVAIAWLAVEGFVTAVRIFKIGVRLEKINLLLTVFLIAVSRGRLASVFIESLPGVLYNAFTHTCRILCRWVCLQWVLLLVGV